MTSTAVALRSGRPLAPMQRGLWASQRRNPKDPVQNSALLSHIDASIDPARFAAAFATVVAASDALRTRIVDSDGESRVLLDPEPAATPVIAVARREADAWARGRVLQPLDMGICGHDSVLLAHEDGTWSWYLGLHHTIVDAASRSLVFDATAAVYAGEPLPPIEPYYPWAAEVAGAEVSARTERARSHWRSRQPAPRAAQLYRPASRPGVSSRRYVVPIDAMRPRIDSALADAYRMISPDLAWTVLLVTAAAIHVRRLSGADRFAIGLPVHNRAGARAQRIIGPVMEVYPVDIEIRPDDTHRALHQRVGRAVVETMRKATPGSAPTTPDFDVVVNVIGRSGLGSFAGLATTTTWVDANAADPSNLMRLQLTTHSDTPELAIEINEDAAPPVHADRVAVHHAAMLDALVRDPDALVAGAGIITPDERVTIDRWGVGAERRTEPRLLLDRLGDALQGSQHRALVEGDDALTGDELWAAAGRTASWLAARGVGAGQRVAISLERSTAAVVAILGVLRSGASYVPLDLAQPVSRRQALAARADCALVIGPGDLDPLIAASSTDPPLGEEPDARPGPDDEAYLLYTSGSSGKPKGVPITHRGLADYIDFAHGAYLEADEAPVVALFSSLTFDLTVTSLFLPLVAGGRIVVIAAEGPSGLVEVAHRRDITWMKATPSHLRVLAHDLPADHGLRTLVVGGEAFGSALAHALWTKLPSLAVFNEYGPTEAVVGCMIHRADPDHDGHDVPIGVPAPGVELRIVDGALGHAPIGAVGELLISHRGVTAGYLDPDDDQDRFVDLDGRRWYRSGDLVRLSDDDTCVYLGRADEQLKVGGIRLDPTEVEAAIADHPSVTAAAVRLWSPQQSTDDRHCVRCGLASSVPGISFDDAGVCSTCLAYARVADAAADYFGVPDDLIAIRDEARRTRTGDYDCLHLLSGGKDSTYALHRLVEMGFSVYALTLDNGFISEQAMDNVRRTCASLGVRHEFATTESMNEIFRDSLERYSNVCHGCYKTIYTLATTRAVELGIPTVVTGLSHGQLFETRLIPAQFSGGGSGVDVEAIDRAVVEARKVYHRIDDGPNRLLDTSVFDDDTVFDRIRYVDFYRYVDLELSELYGYLDAHAPWVRPTDTGRSTNCLINAAGIHTHLSEQGYHNYAEPYAWDVRLGHKTRDEALAELDDRSDLDEVTAMLDTVGYEPRRREVLCAWVTPAAGASEPSPAQLRAFLAERLPVHAIPAAFVSVDALPMTTNGKLDIAALPAPERVHRPGSALHVAPESAIEATVVSVWERVLGIEPIGVDDDFFALGGDSLAALAMAAGIGDALGIELLDELVFLHTTPRELAAHIDEHDTTPTSPIGDAPVDDTALTPYEAALLFDAASDTTGVRYHVAQLIVSERTLDPEAVRAGLEVVVDRHRALHRSYDGTARRLPLDAALVTETRDVAVERSAAAETVAVLQRAPLDPVDGPIARAIVVPVEDGATMIGLAVHHVAADAAGFALIWRELDLLLGGVEPAALPEPEPRRTLPLVTDRDAAHWAQVVEELQGSRLALVAPAPGEPDGYLRRRLDLRASDLRHAVGATGFSTALAAVSSVLAAHGDPAAAELAVSVSVRGAPPHRSVDYRLNMLPARVELQPDDTWATLAARADAVAAAALAHRHYPYAWMVDDARRAGRSVAATSVLLSYEQADEIVIGGLVADHEVLSNGAAVTDLTFFVQVQGDDVHLAVEYRGAVVGEAAARRLLDAVETALVALVRTPLDQVSAAPGHPAALVGQPFEGNSGIDIVADIERHLRSGDDRRAVVCGDHEVTWSELDGRSRAIAGELIAAGVGVGDRVVVAIERAPAVVAAILGVLRSGAAYVPVDPSQPADRVRRSIELADAAAIVTTPGSHHLVSVATPDGDAAPAAPSPMVVVLDADATIASDRVGADLVEAPTAGPADPAYVIFTSGSTGAPRAVTVSRANLTWSTRARGPAYGDDPERFLLISSVAFDSSVVGLFWTLAAGGTLVIVSDDEVHDVDALGALLERHEVTHTLMVPSLYQALLDRCAASAHWPRQVIVAGEACSTALVERHHALRPDSRLTNEYGPTEASVWATFHHCEPGEGAVAIGVPVPGAWVAVVDREGRPRPVGVAGELVIGGPGVTIDASGGEHPEAGPGATYATGDLAVVADDAVVHFLGRLDNQLNLGGVRIEPEEIEAVLTNVPAVVAAIVGAVDPRSVDDLLAVATVGQTAAAAALAAADPDPATALRAALRDAVGAQPILAAHLEAPDGVDLDRVRVTLRAALPAPARPSILVVHERLPRTPNGKLDRTAALDLPLPTTSAASPTPPDAMAGDHLDRARSLFVEAIGPGAAVVLDGAGGGDITFLDAGGNSLSALRLADTAQRTAGIELALADIVGGLTPRLLGVALLDARSATTESSVRGLAGGESDGDRHDADTGGPYPVSPSQQRLWIHQQVRGATLSYLLRLELLIDGPLDHELLQRALAAVVNRHEVLRTRIVPDDRGHPRQVVDPATPRHEITEITDDAVEHRLATAAFDLAESWPMRAWLRPLGPDRHRLSIVFHHIAVDGQSLQIVSHDLRCAYDALQTGRDPSTALGTPTTTFGAIARQQRRRIESGALDDARNWWVDTLTGLDPTPLPGRRGDAAPTGAVELVPVPVDRATEVRLFDATRQLGLTPDAAIVALAQLWLAAVTDRSDVAVGGPVTERRSAELADVVGPFVNLAAYRTAIDPAATVAATLTEAAQRFVRAVDHAEVPFDQVARALDAARDLDHLPFFDVTCAVFDPGPSEAVTAGELTWTPEDRDTWVGGLLTGLMVEGRIVDGGLGLALRFDPGVVDPAVVPTFAASLAAMVAAVADRIETGATTTVAELPLVDDDTAAVLLGTWNATARPFPADELLGERLGRIATEFPDRSAVADATSTVHYGALLARADALAGVLADAGIGAGDVVGIDLPRSIDLVVAICGIVRAGAVYLPLDASAPPARSEQMLTTAGAVAVLGASSLRPDATRSADEADAAVTGIGGISLTRRRVDAPPLLPAADAPVACVMFTSGSTGNPKGAMVTHRGIQRLVHDADYVALDHTTVMGFASNPAFDALTFELWGALANGGRLELIDADTLLDPDRFAAAIATRGITTMVVPTSVFDLVSRRRPDAFASMQDLLVGGEALDPIAVTRVLPCGPRRLVNAYGPTEAAVIAATGEITDIVDGATSVPIGRPIANTTIDLVDRHGRLVPIGAEGELVIGGPGVAAGYIGDAERTASAFVTSPIRPGETVYRTGDIGRRLPDGRIEFVGRRDRQVKLRGHRIELAEIDRVIAGTDGVAAATTIVAGSGTQRRLVTTVVATAGSSPHPSALRQAAAERLPASMVPAAVVVIDEFPLTPTGKLDRQAIEALATQPSLAGAMASSTRAPLDRSGVGEPESVAAMSRRWAVLLGVEAVDPDDDFFALGGHSLLAVELMTEIERDTGVRPPLSALFDDRTPRRLAARLSGSVASPGRRAGTGAGTAAGAAASGADPVVVLRPGDGSQPPLWLMHPAGGNHLLYEPLAARLDPALAILGVEAIGIHGESAPLRRIEDLADHQTQWIRARQPHGPYRLLGYSVGGLIGLEVARRLIDAGETVDHLGVVCGGAPGATAPIVHPSRLGAYAEMLRARDLQGVRRRFGDNVSRRLEQLAVERLGVRPSPRRIDEAVRLAMVEAFVAYEGPPLDVAVHLTMGLDNPDELIERLRAAWGRLAVGGVTMHRVPGWHDTVLVAPAVDALAEVVQSCLHLDSTVPSDEAV